MPQTKLKLSSLSFLLLRGKQGISSPTFEHPLKEANQNQIVKLGVFTSDEVSSRRTGKIIKGNKNDEGSKLGLVRELIFNVVFK